MNEDFLRVLVNESVGRAVRRVRIPELRPGTVATAAGPLVLVDGDDMSIHARSLIGVLTVGQRVMVLFYPPAGAVVIGKIGSSRQAWTTPIATGITVGSGGTVDAVGYERDGDHVHGELRFKMGTGSAITGEVTINLPVPALMDWGTRGHGYCWGANLFALMVTSSMTTATTQAQVRALSVASTYAYGAPLSATVPFTWSVANVDEINVTLDYFAGEP